MGKEVWKRPVDDTNACDSACEQPFFKRKTRHKRIPKYKRQLKRLTATTNFIKIMRFRSKNLNKTFRIYCFDENTLGWPRRFTKKVNKMQFDNDQDSDEQLVEQAKEKCFANLLQAIQLRDAQRISCK